MSVPSSRIRPLLGASSPAINPSSVDFPLPDGPVIATVRPLAIWKDVECRMVSGDPPLVTVLETSRSSIIRGPTTELH